MYGGGIAIGMTLLALGGAVAAPGHSSIRWWVVTGVLVVSLVIGPLVASRLPQFRLPGHVAGCDAVNASGTGSEITLLLGNRAYAKLMRAMIVGRPLDPWMTELLRPLVIERSSPEGRMEPPRRLTERDRKLGDEGLREDVRQRASAAARAPARGRSNVSDLKTGTDAAADTLRFVAKACELGPMGVRATSAGGAIRTLAWNEIARAFLRELPAGPPFEGVWFVDLLPAAGPPIRLLPSTRANYGVLEGTGLTSKDNFKRLLRGLLAKNPSCVLDDATVAFVERGRAPARFENVDELAAHERRYDA
jgi:hypothetical protein